MGNLKNPKSMSFFIFLTKNIEKGDVVKKFELEDESKVKKICCPGQGELDVSS